jgi:hypothetical protein
MPTSGLLGLALRGFPARPIEFGGPCEEIPYIGTRCFSDKTDKGEAVSLNRAEASSNALATHPFGRAPLAAFGLLSLRPHRPQGRLSKGSEVPCHNRLSALR